jgi:hypothetical protein
MNEIVRTLAKVNKVDIQVVERLGEKHVPIKPICDAVGVDFEGQRQRIERDEILSSVAFMTKATGADEKTYEMFCLPLKYVFGWLFGIDTGRVKEEARAAVIAYKHECYNALFRYFTSRAEFVEKKQMEIDRQLSVVDTAKRDFCNAKNILSDAEGKLKVLRKLTMDDFDPEQRQLKINLDN